MIALLPSLALARPAAAEADRPRRFLPARLHVVGIVLRAAGGGAGRDSIAAERHVPARLDPQRQLLPAQRQRAVIHSDIM